METEMNATGKKRLLRLAAKLREDAENPEGMKFDINHWGSTRDKEHGLALSCGTTGCAMGLAAISGIFKRAGLGIDGLTAPGEPLTFIWRFTMNGEPREGWEAAAQLFGIELKQAQYLFYAGHYPSAKRKGRAGELAVAERIEVVLAGGFPPEEKMKRYAGFL